MTIHPSLYITWIFAAIESESAIRQHEKKLCRGLCAKYHKMRTDATSGTMFDIYNKQNKQEAQTK